MAPRTLDTEAGVAEVSPDHSIMHEKGGLDGHHETTTSAAERGHLATDRFGHSLVEFDKAAEARLTRKIDRHIIPIVFLLYLFCFIDRANIGNAKLAHLEKSLKMSGYDYNALLSVFYISYILCEIPANTACKLIGPGWWIPFISMMFGCMTIAFAYVTTLSQAMGVRFLLGMFEAGMLPGISYYLSRWYRRRELAFRLSMCFVSAPLAGAFGGLLASGILTLKHFAGLHEWRMIFGIEGIVTVGLSLIAFFTLTDRPASARWLNAEEKALAIARVKSEMIGATEVLDKVDSKKSLRGIFSPVTLATGIIFMMDNITVQGLAVFAPTIVKTIYPKNTVVSQQLHTVPPYVVGAFFTVFVPYMSGVIDSRVLPMICSAPLIMIGYIMFLVSTHAMVRYGATFLITIGAFTFGVLCTAHAANNAVSDTARSFAIGTVVMLGNTGGLISTWGFIAKDAPNYHIGNGLNLATSTVILITGVAMYLWMRRDNRKRQGIDVDVVLSGMSQQQVQDLDWKHPSFRWQL